MASSVGGVRQKDTEMRLPRATQVKNKQPAPQQITVEQILRESKELQEQDFKPPRQKISDPQELAEYRLRKRKEYEDLVRRVRWNQSVWVKYATWEEAQKDFRRARSVWERALEVSYTSVSLWLKYAEMEMRHRFVNHARNVWDRAVTLLPRVDQLWYKYIHMEEMLGNVPAARQIFERWMQWEPDHHGWAAYVKMELRYNEVDKARNIYERYVKCLPTVKAWARYAKFEMQNGQVGLARRCYERAIEQLGEDAQTEELFIKFAEFEERCKEPVRARAIYKFALDHIPRGQAEGVYKRFVVFEKQHGDRQGIEDVVVSERRFQYDAEVTRSPMNYDAWFDYVRLEESAGDPARVREVYERAVAQVPPALEKRYWQRYIYLWICYALFEELEAEDPDRTREVYRTCLKLIPHDLFTFAKIWILAAQFEIRQFKLDSARKILGMAIGKCPKDKLFKSYIEIEHQLGNLDRCRRLYERYLAWNPANCQAWCRFADLERSLAETDRTRALFELAIQQPLLDMPEVLWKTYIDFEISEGNRDRARKLYERLLARTKHVKVWISYAAFEATPQALLGQQQEEEEEQPRANGNTAGARRAAALQAEDPMAAAAREEQARSLRESQPDAKEEAVMLLEAWRAFEAESNSSSPAQQQAAVEAVEKRMPKRVKRKRRIETDDGSDAGMEEYYDYIFPDEGAAAPNLKLLEAAQAWKRRKLEADARAAA